MRDSTKKWYTTKVDFELVEQRCAEYFENYYSEGPIYCQTGDVSISQPTIMDWDIKIFVSTDLYKQLLHQMSQKMRYNGPSNGVVQVASFVSSVGQFPFVETREHNNLLYVGTVQQLNRIVWEEVDQVFEEEFLK